MNTHFPGLIEGRMVHYVLTEGRHKGEHRAAIVVRVPRDIGEDAQRAGCCELHIHLSKGDVDVSSSALYGRENVLYSEEPVPGTWHWPERA